MGVIAGHCAPRVIRLPLAYGKLRVASRASLGATRRHYAQRAACIDARRARGNARTVTRAARGAQ